MEPIAGLPELGPLDRNELGGGAQKAAQLRSRQLPWLVAVLLKERPMA
jgi:hypothetical protein